MRTVIVHDEMGVYLGACFGLGFWTRLDTVGQNTAVTFKNEFEASQYIVSWESDNDPKNYKFFTLPGHEEYATVADLVHAGLGPYLGDMAANQ